MRVATLHTLRHRMLHLHRQLQRRTQQSSAARASATVDQHPQIIYAVSAAAEHDSPGVQTPPPLPPPSFLEAILTQHLQLAAAFALRVRSSSGRIASQKCRVYPGHPECAARVPAILSALDSAGLTATARPQQVHNSAPTSLSLRMLPLPISVSLGKGVSLDLHNLPHQTLLSKMVWCGSQIVQLSNFRRATPTEVFAVHREHYVEQLRSVVASKAPAMVETAPTYVTTSSFDDALGVRHIPSTPACI